MIVKLGFHSQLKNYRKEAQEAYEQLGWNGWKHIDTQIEYPLTGGHILLMTYEKRR